MRIDLTQKEQLNSILLSYWTVFYKSSDEKLTSRTRLPLPTNVIDLTKQIADSKVDTLCNVAMFGTL